MAELLRSIKLQEIPMNQPQNDRLRRLAKYENGFVLVDPKNYGENPNDELGEKVYDRVRELADIMHGWDHDQFRTLICKGWFEDAVKGQFCFVMELPTECREPALPKYLHSYVESSFKPSVTARVRLAHLLAQSLRQIHQAGYLHKGFRSDNVIFFPETTGGQRSIDHPRLVGFDFARKDEPGQYSEKRM